MRIRVNLDVFRGAKAKFFDLDYRGIVKKSPQGIGHPIWRERFTNLVARPLLKPTAVTPAVKAYASKFPDTIKGVVNMIEDLSRVEFVKVGLRTATKLYGAQTAHDVIVMRKIHQFSLRVSLNLVAELSL